MKPNTKTNPKHRDERKKHDDADNITYQSMAGIFERISDGFVALDYEMNFTYVNKRGGELLGRHPQDLIGKNCWKEYPEAKGTLFEDAYVRALKTQTSIQLQGFYEPWKRWFENRIYPSKDGLSVFFQDITERKQADEQLKYQAQLLAQVNDAVIATDENFVLTSWNQAAERIYGWQEQEVIGKTSEEILRTEFFDQTRDQILKEFRRTGEFSAEVIHRRKDGTRIDIEAHTVALHDESGNITGYVSINRDISNRRKTEEALRLSDQILNHVNALVLVADDQGKIVYVSPATKSILGYEPEELLGDKWWEVSRFDPIEGRREKESIREAARGEIPVDGQAYERAIKDRWGNTRWISWVDVRGPGNLLIGVGHDVTERVQLNSDIHHRNQILSALQESTLVLMERRKLTDVLQTIVAQVLRLMDTPNGFLYLVEPDGKNLRLRVGLGINFSHIGITLKLGEGLAGKIWKTGQPLVVQDYHHWVGRSRQFEEFEIRAMVGVPLTSGSQVIGVLGVNYLDAGRRISQDDVDLLKRFAQLASIALENTQSFQAAKDELNERIRAEAALVEAEAKYRSLVERLPAVVYTSELGIAGVWHYVSPQIESLLGFTPEEWMADPNLWYQQTNPHDRDRQMDSEEQAYRRGEAFDTEYRIKRRDGREVWVRDTAHILPREGGSPIVQGVLVDITERKRAEEALQESEETTRLIIDTALDAVITIDEAGKVTRWNDQAKIIFGWTQEEAVGQPLSQLIIPPDLRAQHEQGLKHYLETGEGPVLDKRIEITGQRRNGEVFPVELTIHALKTDRKVSFAAFVRDIAERKQAEEALSNAHEDLERLVQERTAALSQANMLLQTMLDHVPDHIFFKDLQSRFIRNSRSQAEMLGLSDPSQVVGKSDFDFFPHAQQAYEEEQSIIKSGQPMVDFEEHVFWPDGRETWVSTTKVPLQDEQGGIVGTFGIARDITERKRADEALRKTKDELELRVAERTAELNRTNEQLRLELNERKQIEESLRAAEMRYRTLVEQLPIVIYVSPAGDICSTTYISPQINGLLGYTQEQWLNDPKFWSKVLHPLDRSRVLAQFEHVDRTGEPPDMEYRMIAKDNSVVWIREQATVLRDSAGHPLLWQGLMIDITDRKQAEEALKSSETRYRLATRATNDVIWDFDMANNLHTWNENVLSLSGYTADEAASNEKWWHEHIHPTDQERVLLGLKAFYESHETIWADEYRFLRRDGSIAYITDRGYVERDWNGKPLRMIGAMSDITARKLAEDQIKRRVDHLKALRIIDMTITASTDLHFSLQTVLRQAISQLQVDAADILLLNPTTHILEYSDGIGFYTKAIERSSVRIGEGYAGRAALERRMVNIHSLYESKESFNRRLLLDGENFTGYYGVPLIAKGEVKGVLEVFHRSHMEVDQEWLDFLESLAGQAGLAIDNATLFQNLQRTNLELGMAYESTLEGWSAALDLRDKETEGHTLRVTNLTLQLAEHMGLKDKDLIHIRRGALLHDIGKMGVPDRILLKPDTLTSEEWEIMKLHPAHAYEMLSRIEYLRPSLDIPYCHHEKWDGSGYPRGLKGEEIPLHARIFAVVDVYDALTSDRPYRPAWTKERVLEYIKSLSETHFDPRVVTAFIELLNRR